MRCRVLLQSEKDNHQFRLDVQIPCYVRSFVCLDVISGVCPAGVSHFHQLIRVPTLEADFLPLAIAALGDQRTTDSPTFRWRRQRCCRTNRNTRICERLHPVSTWNSDSRMYEIRSNLFWVKSQVSEKNNRIFLAEHQMRKTWELFFHWSPFRVFMTNNIPV